MANNERTTVKQPATRKPVQQAVTMKTLEMMIPTVAKADRIVTTYGLEPVDYNAIRENITEQVVRISNELTDNLNKKALEIFLQRVVGSFVMAAHGAGKFYGNKRSDAQALRTRLLDDHREGDRDGVAGFESKAERACIFAAELGLQAFALMAAADGAVTAYEHVTGDEWKPYESNAPTQSGIGRQALGAMADALND